jgi:hypothetical protein
MVEVSWANYLIFIARERISGGNGFLARGILCKEERLLAGKLPIFCFSLNATGKLRGAHQIRLQLTWARTKWHLRRNKN